MLEIASQMILCLLLAALLGLIIGYLWGKSTCPDKDCDDTTTQRGVYSNNHSLHQKETHNQNTVKVKKELDSNKPHNNNAAETILSTSEIEIIEDSTDESVTTLSSITEVENVGSEPLLLSEPRNGEKDNLTRIKGIGLKINEKLNSMGIYHFDQIANWSKEEADWVDSQTFFPGRVQREHWVEQAKELAAGQETEFSKRVDKGEVASSKKS